MDDIAAAMQSRLEEMLALTDQLRRGSKSPIIGDTTFRANKTTNTIWQSAHGDPSANARILLNVRRARDKMFGSDLFGEPAWDMLLDLFIHQVEGKRVSVSSLCVASAGPQTTALRHIGNLTDRGILQRVTDPRDARRVWLSISPIAFNSMKRILIF